MGATCTQDAACKVRRREAGCCGVQGGADLVLALGRVVVPGATVAVPLGPAPAAASVWASTSAAPDVSRLWMLGVGNLRHQACMSWKHTVGTFAVGSGHKRGGDTCTHRQGKHVGRHAVLATRSKVGTGKLCSMERTGGVEACPPRAGTRC